MWVMALIVTVQVKVVLVVLAVLAVLAVVLVVEEVGEAEGRDSYCEIPVEELWPVLIGCSLPGPESRRARSGLEDEGRQTSPDPGFKPQNKHMSGDRVGEEAHGNVSAGQCYHGAVSAGCSAP
ncbi:hypothetical protein EYF80_052130 [Liparis tanakae]|uniref:Uncharacterized protein n=1 Tax=Liparis tanakae TaxID=230148 RepID=A0A4Z2F966_9TELE|nr:hypothetical protein EYF80_052130 [Liparis tanakae]